MTGWEYHESLRSVVHHHTTEGTFKLSGGGEAGGYLDLRSALLCHESPTCCASRLVLYYTGKIAEIAGDDEGVTVVGTGAFGAALLALLSDADRGVRLDSYALWNPKGHGVAWSGRTGVHARAVLVDDVVTTGGTLAALRAATGRLLTSGGQLVEVLGEAVAVRRGGPA